MARFILLSLNAVAVFALLAAYSASYINPQQQWLPAFFGLAYPVILAINFTFVMVWLLLWKKYLFLSLIAILIGWNYLTALLPLSGRQTSENVQPCVKVVTYNIHRMFGNERSSQYRVVSDQITEFLQSEKPDILLLQEFYSRGEPREKAIGDFLRKVDLEFIHLENYQPASSGKINAIAICSALPIVNSGHLRLPEGSLFAVWADVILNSDTIRIYNLHLQSIRFGNEDYKFYSNLTGPDPEVEKLPLKEGSKRMIQKLRKAFIRRASQVDSLTAHLAACPYPVIAGGDFNDTPSSHTYHQMTRRLRDAFGARGSSINSSTYAGQLPSFRIDYVMHSGHFRALTYHKSDIPWSDHFPVSVMLSCEEKSKRGI